MYFFSVEEDLNEDEDEEDYLEQDDAIDKEEIADVEDSSGIRALIPLSLICYGVKNVVHVPVPLCKFSVQLFFVCLFFLLFSIMMLLFIFS